MNLGFTTKLSSVLTEDSLKEKVTVKLRNDFWATGSCKKKGGWILSIYKRTGDLYDTIKIRKM
jgi:hypothetical protein